MRTWAQAATRGPQGWGTPETRTVATEKGACVTCPLPAVASPDPTLRSEGPELGPAPMTSDSLPFLLLWSPADRKPPPHRAWVEALCSVQLFGGDTQGDHTGWSREGNVCESRPPPTDGMDTQARPRATHARPAEVTGSGQGE